MNSFCSYIFRKFIFDWFFHHCDFVLQGTSYDTKDKRTERSKSWSKCKAKDEDFVPQSSSHDTKDKRTERSQTWCKAKDQDEDVSRTVSYKGSPCKVEFDPLMGMRVLSKMILLIMFKFFQACTKKWFRNLYRKKELWEFKYPNHQRHHRHLHKRGPNVLLLRTVADLKITIITKTIGNTADPKMIVTTDLEIATGTGPVHAVAIDIIPEATEGLRRLNANQALGGHLRQCPRSINLDLVIAIIGHVQDQMNDAIRVATILISNVSQF